MDCDRHRDDSSGNLPKGVLGIDCPRRSSRKAASLPIRLRNEELGPIWEEEAETEVLSRYGAGLRCRHFVEADRILVMVRKDNGRRVNARVRYCRYNPDGRRELGIEFIGSDNFWGLDWNRPEPVESQPEQFRTPSGPAQGEPVLENPTQASAQENAGKQPERSG